ncbi:MAG: hypothetical protein CVU47_10700 [Chloroflexi bacterium HGW-Chloroflexi-9]|nr:MAG: hypothetical protein CVU47_10700 [Chloroflexi bacterium HGW-Chloroflexi-9]
MPFQPKEWEPNPRWVPKEQRAKPPTPDGTAPPRPHEPRLSADIRLDLLIFGATFIVALSVSVYTYYALGIWNADSLSRTIDAQAVLYSRDPHLGAIGFVWPPLPTLARIALMPITHPLGFGEFTGQLTSVIFTAALVVLLQRILRNLGLPGRTRAIWIAVAMLNPVVLLHFTNGTAESAFTLLLLLVIHSTLRLSVTPVPAISGMGVAIAAALGVRYEALAIAGMAALGILFFGLVQRRRAGDRVRNVRVEGMVAGLLFPVVFVGSLWMFFNWTIQGDPLFFYTSPFSIRGAADVARNVPGHVLEYAMHSVTGTLRYVTERTLQVSIVFIPAALALAIHAVRRRDPVAVTLLLVSLAVHAMQAYQAFTGSIAPWLRYWVYLPLLTPIALAYLLGPAGWGARLRGANRTLALSILLPVMLLTSNAVSFVSMQSPTVGYDEQIFSHELAGNLSASARVREQIPDKESAREIASYLNAIDGTVLVDKQRAALFMLGINDPARFIIDADRDFSTVIRNPAATADWVLLPDPSNDSAAVASHDSIYTVYPDLYEGAPWLTLEYEFDQEHRDWRLYRVIGSPEGATGGPGAGPETASPTPSAAP